MIYLTGDTHIPIDIQRLGSTHFWEQKKLTRKDYVIVLGDFGLLWKEDNVFRYWKHWLNQKPYTILWIDGNHENFDWIHRLPISEWHGGNVQILPHSKNIIHLMRGQIYTIEGKHFFTMGGAQSIDKEQRTEHISWWKEEIPSTMEGMQALDRLDAFLSAGNHIDYVLSHTCPYGIIRDMFPDFSGSYETDPTTKLLEAIRSRVEDTMEGWYFGHWHKNRDFYKYHCLYNKITQLVGCP